MEKVEINEIIDKAKNLSNENKDWHFHMLGKDCKFNDNKGKFSIVFEKVGANQIYYSLFDAKPLKEAKILADLMYGEDFLAKQEKDEHNPDFDAILNRAKELTSKDKEWHHHHLHPNCIFNEHKGKHCIILEDTEKNQVLTAYYNKKPMEDLVKIEKLFYNELLKK